MALGRAQELLLILEDCWQRHPELRNVPIYQTSGLATQALGVYQSYIEMMNDDIRGAFKQRNPFEFRHIKHSRGFRADSELGPCVVLATPSMLQTGLSRELFEAWCEDPRNGVVIADFAVQVPFDTFHYHFSALFRSPSCDERPTHWRAFGVGYSGSRVADKPQRSAGDGRPRAESAVWGVVLLVLGACRLLADIDIHRHARARTRRPLPRQRH